MTVTIARGIPNVTAEWVPLKRVPHRHTDRRRRIAKKKAARDR